MDPFKKKQEEITTQKFREALKKSLNKKKKPVRFTWEGLGNLGISLTTNPGLIPLRQKRLEELKAGSKANEKDYIDFFEDIEASFIGGIQDLTFTELRARLPQSIDNTVVQLLANSKQALLDFANIRDQQDVDQFNQQYGVNLNIPQEG